MKIFNLRYKKLKLLKISKKLMLIIKISNKKHINKSMKI